MLPERRLHLCLTNQYAHLHIFHNGKLEYELQADRLGRHLNFMTHWYLNVMTPSHVCFGNTLRHLLPLKRSYTEVKEIETQRQFLMLHLDFVKNLFGFCRPNTENLTPFTVHGVIFVASNPAPICQIENPNTYLQEQWPWVRNRDTTQLSDRER